MKNNILVLLKIFKETGLIFWSVENINWNVISCKSLSENFILEFQNEVDWYSISTSQKLSEDFIREFQNEVYWYNISMHQKLSENFIREFKDRVNWTNISKFQFLSENFIREFKNEVDWFKISRCQKLSENFIREFKDKVNWECISVYQKLSENFIREFKDKVDWVAISQYQKLSENFIKEFKNEVYWYYICENQKLSPDFIKEFNLLIDDDNWLYKDTEFKKNKVIETKLYKCYNDYFIAYKSIRNDRYSFFNFQYQYLKGGLYECHCDCTKNENSFGLSSWTKEKALEYNDTGLIVKVKIKYEDVGRVVHKGGKIRCFKFEVLD